MAMGGGDDKGTGDAKPGVHEVWGATYAVVSVIGTPDTFHRALPCAARGHGGAGGEGGQTAGVGYTAVGRLADRPPTRKLEKIVPPPWTTTTAAEGLRSCAILASS